MRTSGVTLVELMVVLVLIAIMCTVMAPNISRWASAIRFNTSTREVVSQLQLARLQAIARNTEFQACFYPPRPPDFPQAFLSTHATSTGWCARPPAHDAATFDDFKKTVTMLPPGMTLVHAPTTLRFRSRGSAVGGTIILANPVNGKRAEIVVALTGRVRLVNY